MSRKESQYRKYLDKPVFTRMRVLIILSILFIVITIYEVLVAGFNIFQAMGSILIGLLVGIVVSRRYHLSWDSESQQVVSNIDWIGAVIFILYIIFMIGRSVVVGYWVHGTAYFGIIFAITAGVMIGRLVGTKHTINKIREDLRKIRESLTWFPIIIWLISSNQ